MFTDSALAELLWERVKPFHIERGLKEGVGEVVDKEEQKWSIQGLNERFRLCRYLPCGKLAPHTDGRRMANLDAQSFMTLTMYLNTVRLEHKVPRGY